MEISIKSQYFFHNHFFHIDEDGIYNVSSLFKNFIDNDFNEGIIDFDFKYFEQNYEHKRLEDDLRRNIKKTFEGELLLSQFNEELLNSPIESINLFKMNLREGEFDFKIKIKDEFIDCFGQLLLDSYKHNFGVLDLFYSYNKSYHFDCEFKSNQDIIDNVLKLNPSAIEFILFQFNFDVNLVDIDILDNKTYLDYIDLTDIENVVKAIEQKNLDDILVMDAHFLRNNQNLINQIIERKLKINSFDKLIDFIQENYYKDVETLNLELIELFSINNCLDYDFTKIIESIMRKIEDKTLQIF